jgi:site-specific DNA-methyltransferase (adenine-specific)
MEAALEKGYHELPGDEPASEDAVRWDGWGTALKPGAEHWILVRKPLSEKNVAANVLKWGTGALNVDGSRIGTDVVGWGGKSAGGDTWNETNSGLCKDGEARPVTGRWPANVVLDEDAAMMLDEQSGVRESGKPSGERNATIGFQGGGHVTELTRYGDRGGASRFYFVAKPSAAEKHDALKRLSLFDADPNEKPEKNAHPTVKPIELMRYFVRMVTPPGGTVLDCFGGSGTTGIAAIMEGFDVTVIEREPDYARTAEARMAQAALERGAA